MTKEEIIHELMRKFVDISDAMNTLSKRAQEHKCPSERDVNNMRELSSMVHAIGRRLDAGADAIERELYRVR